MPSAHAHEGVMRERCFSPMLLPTRVVTPQDARLRGGAAEAACAARSTHAIRAASRRQRTRLRTTRKKDAQDAHYAALRHAALRLLPPSSRCYASRLPRVLLRAIVISAAFEFAFRYITLPRYYIALPPRPCPHAAMILDMMPLYEVCRQTRCFCYHDASATNRFFGAYAAF